MSDLDLEKTKRQLNADRWKVAGICVFLAAMVWIVFGQTLRHHFVNYDDDEYVYGNADVIRGLTLDGATWAFTHIHAGNWHPLTTLSHMLDCQLYGLHAWGHHLTNVLLHMIAAILLFLMLRGMTGALWRSAFVALIFAIHPLRVESVAWVAERKDVLSGVLFILTLWAYARYARGETRSAWRYAIALLLFALGLMCKPTLVTLPFVLLLLDYWPLQRFVALNNRTMQRLLFEKIPFFALSVVSCVVTVSAQKRGFEMLGKLSFPTRVGNALWSYVVYLWQMICPVNLVPLYPFPVDGLAVGKIVFAVLLLAAISGGVFLLRRRHPFLFVGWLWYLGMLIPMIGVVQVGLQAHADRYTYLPQIGLSLALVWSVAEILARWQQLREALFIAILMGLTVLTLGAYVQTAYWRDNETLWKHTLACTKDNYLPENNLGHEYLERGLVDEAIPHLRKSLAIKPEYALAHSNLGNALAQKGQVDEAILHYREALKTQPELSAIHNNLGNSFLRKGRIDEAIACFETALKYDPGMSKAHDNLGNALVRKGRMREAIAQYQKAVELDSETPQFLINLAVLLCASTDDSLRDGRKALALAQHANELTGGNDPLSLATLAAAYAELGLFPQAVETAQRALNSSSVRNNSNVRHLLEASLRRYQDGKPMRLTAEDFTR